MRKNDQVETKKKISVLQSTTCTAHDLQESTVCAVHGLQGKQRTHRGDWSDCMSSVCIMHSSSEFWCTRSLTNEGLSADWNRIVTRIVYSLLLPCSLNWN